MDTNLAAKNLFYYSYKNLYNQKTEILKEAVIELNLPLEGTYYLMCETNNIVRELSKSAERARYIDLPISLNTRANNAFQVQYDLSREEVIVKAYLLRANLFIPHENLLKEILPEVFHRYLHLYSGGIDVKDWAKDIAHFKRETRNKAAEDIIARRQLMNLLDKG